MIHKDQMYNVNIKALDLMIFHVILQMVAYA